MPAKLPPPRDPLKKLRRRPDLLMRQVGLDVALYDPAAQTMHLLNPVAAAVWHHITPGRTLKNIADALQLTFGKQNCSGDQVTDDVAYAIESFARVRLLVPANTPPPPPEPNCKPVMLGIPDREISGFNGYTRPTFKSYGLAELNDVFALNRTVAAPFSDLMLSEQWTRVV